MHKMSYNVNPLAAGLGWHSQQSALPQFGCCTWGGVVLVTLFSPTWSLPLAKWLLRHE